MKRISILILLLIKLSFEGIAQKNDYQWVMGHYYSSSVPLFNLDFSNGSPNIASQNRTMSFYITNASISDTSGQLHFYTNGSWVANRFHDTLSNSQNFNPGFFSTYYTTGMGFSQSAIILPTSNNSQSHYLITESAEPFFNIPDVQPLHLNYSVVDMNLDSGKGGIIPGLKDIQVIQDTLLLGRITACKHANGRDWWVVVHQYATDMYFKLLFTPYGTMGPYGQHIGPIFPRKTVNGGDFDINGMAVFSPDGSKYAMVGPSNEMDVMDFDRCTGMFSNHQTVLIPDTFSSLGCSFSSDSRFLYANTFVNAFQYDTYSSNINSSGILIAQYDSFFDPFQTWFFMNQLGPDGKIYISTWCGCFSMHVIESPDSLGLGSNFNQHSFTFPGYTENLTVPNFPNYRLGALVGSGCDTLTEVTSIKSKESRLKISPNPNNGNFIIDYSLPQNRSGTLNIYNTIGEKVYSMPLPQWSIMQRINISNLPSGVYLCNVSSQNQVGSMKFVVEK